MIERAPPQTTGTRGVQRRFRKIEQCGKADVPLLDRRRMGNPFSSRTMRAVTGREEKEKNECISDMPHTLQAALAAESGMLPRQSKSVLPRAAVVGAPLIEKF